MSEKFQRPEKLYRQTRYPIWAAARLTQTSRFHDLRHAQASLMIASGVQSEINFRDGRAISSFELDGRYLFARIEVYPQTESGRTCELIV